jgi:hypothetical protein
LQVEAEKMDEALLQAKQALWAGDSDASELLNSAHTQKLAAAEEERRRSAATPASEGGLGYMGHELDQTMSGASYVGVPLSASGGR